MHVKVALAAARQMREGAVSVVRENAVAIVAPGLGVVQSRHWHSLPQILTQAVDDMRVLPCGMCLKPNFCTTNTQLLHQIGIGVWPVSLDVDTQSCAVAVTRTGVITRVALLTEHE